MRLFGETERPYSVLTVGEFTSAIARWFARQGQLQRIGLKGEISNLREFGNGHLGFRLKDGQAIIECVAWSSNRHAFPELNDGVKAVAVGNVSIHPERGGYKLYVESIERIGAGDLFLLYEKLKEKFRSEGLFDAGRKRVVPELLRRVALVSARDGDGARDFMKTIADEVPFVEVVIIETRVEGEGAEIDIAAAIDDASRQAVDAIVLARGGGTDEALFPFNLEPVIRAIVRARRPVITAIGHQPDHLLADDVADRTFDTPSKAAEFIAKAWLVARRRLEVGNRDLDRAARYFVLRREQLLETARGDLERFGLRIVRAKFSALNDRIARLDPLNPQRRLTDFRARLAQGNGRLDTAVARLLASKQRAWGGRRELLAGCDPLAPLARGYAIVTKNGSVVRDATTLNVGDTIAARLERGRLAARVESVASDG